MDPHRIMLVQSSWQQLEPVADTMIKLFYARLFMLDPELRPLFTAVDPTEQQRKLAEVLDASVRTLGRLDVLAPTLEALGRRHAEYGVVDAHYETVGQALLWALEQGQGSEFRSEVRDAWSEAYGLIASVMRSAASAPTPEGQTSRGQ